MCVRVRSVATFNRISKALERGGGCSNRNPPQARWWWCFDLFCLCFVPARPLPLLHVRLSPVINLVFRLRPRSNLSVSLFPSPAAIPSIFFNRPSADRREDRSLRRNASSLAARPVVTGKFSWKNMVGKRL